MARLVENNTFPFVLSEGQERQLRCQQLSASTTRSFENKEVTKSPWASGSSPWRRILWIWTRIGFFSMLVIRRGNNAWPHILWRLTIIRSPIFITNFDLSPADNTANGRTLYPIEISDTESTQGKVNLAQVFSHWPAADSSKVTQHCHFLISCANIWKLMCLHGALLKLEKRLEEISFECIYFSYAEVIQDYEIRGYISWN